MLKTKMLSNESLRGIDKSKLSEYLLVFEGFEESAPYTAEQLELYDRDICNLEDIINYYNEIIESQGGQVKIIHMPTQTLVYEIK